MTVNGVWSEFASSFGTSRCAGREYRAIFISTSEPTERNGKTCNPTKSISDRYVFNTAITRARSLVVAVGNPFLLLRVEDHMVKRYGRRGNCWSTYLHCCLENNSLSIDPSVRVSNSKKRECLDKLRELVQRRSVKSHYVAVEQVPAPVMQITPKPPPAFVSTQGMLYCILNGLYMPSYTYQNLYRLPYWSSHRWNLKLSTKRTTRVKGGEYTPGEFPVQSVLILLVMCSPLSYL